MKKKITTSILIALMAIVCLTEKTYGATVTIDNYETIPNGTYYDCTSSGCSSVSTTTDVYQTLNNEYNMQVNSSTMTIASNGIAFTYQPYETFKSGYLYNVTTYFCSNKNLNTTSKSQFLGSATNSVSTNYSTTSSSTMHAVGTFNYCYEIQSLISPKSNTNQVTYKLTNSSSIAGVYLYSIGFKIKDLGLYTSEVQNIVQIAIQSSTSGLATSTQIEEATTQIEQAESQTTDAVNNQLGNKCGNLIDSSKIVIGDITGANTTIRASSRNRIYLQAGTYYFKTNISNPYQYDLFIQNIGEPPLSSWPNSTIYDSGWLSNSTYTIRINTSGYFTLNLRKNDNGTIDLNTLKSFQYMLSKENKSYCEFGTYSSKLDDTNNILNQEHSYNNNPSQDTTNQENQMNNFEQEEDNLRNSLDLDIEESEITINPYASSFIWEIVNRLRSMSPKIVLLFTSILSLGIMKMILGR